MERKLIALIALVITGVFFSSCSICRHKAKAEPAAKIASPQVIIYKTKADYSQLVPVILSADKKSIASYPDIKDVYYKGQLAHPTQLHKGYLLDNRGISENVAFIKLTYEQYAALPATPGSEELMKMVVDKNPLEKMYACGPAHKFANLLEDLNKRIDGENFIGFTRLK
ncbi:MAG: hypothetical protein HXX13_00630 [Bacteroidetes bacterium]|nr:hypothetical protein [Bacteroidota bacterium]